MTELRVEQDALGEVAVPAGRYYGAQTQRAVENFPISDRRFGRRLIAALGQVKSAAAEANHELGLLDEGIARAIVAAADEVADGRWDAEFVLDVFQTGSGTSTHMNANEVIANRAIEIMGGVVGTRHPVHPNDHVNLGQSSNDVFPTAMHVAAVGAIVEDLLPALDGLRDALADKAAELRDVVKPGRTHGQDAVPVTLGQVFGGYAQQVANAIDRVHGTLPGLLELAIGGTAVGTGLGAHVELAPRVLAGLRARTGHAFVEAPDRFEALAARDAAVHASATMRSVALGVARVASDIRLLSTGPRCGIGELSLPALQPGSSIMPGKVNPVVLEVVCQVAADVIGHDAAVVAASRESLFELNVGMPLIAWSLLDSIELMARAAVLLATRCISKLTADRARCAELAGRSLALVMALNARIGYDRAAELARTAHRTGRSIRDVAAEARILTETELDRLLDPRRLADPYGE